MAHWTLFLTLGLWSSLSLGAVPNRPKVPEIPESGPDFLLTGGKSPREFFEARTQDAACQGELKQAKASYYELRADILKMVEQGKPEQEIDEKERLLDEKRENLLGVLEKCGECATREVETLTVRTVTSSEIWYVSDGSCQIPSKDPAVLKSAFEKMSQSLIHAKSYAKTSEGGFGRILNMQILDESGGKIEFLKDADAFPPSPVNLAIWVLGPSTPFLSTAFAYHMTADYKNNQVEYGGATIPGFELRFQTPKDTTEITFPDVSDSKLSGRQILTATKQLQKVKGLWYVNEDGYVRYFTAAVLPVKMLKNLGRAILIQTLFELSQRGDWETP